MAFEPKSPAEMRKLAEAAIPGPWLPDYPFVSYDRKRPRAGRIAEVSLSHKSSATFEGNLLFIAAANPSQILHDADLIEAQGKRIAELEALAAELDAAFQPGAGRRARLLALRSLRALLTPEGAQP